MWQKHIIMNCFLIDFENVRSSGLKGIEHLTNIDDVCIFYSDYANSITFDIHHSMNKSSANITFFKSTRTGKNALDFQLISYLGYLIAQKKYKNYYIITGDRGFESAISFWKDFFKENNMNYLNIGRFYTIKDATENKKFPYKNIKDTLPTIPTVESELELRQLKAEKVIVDINSNKIEKSFESSQNKNVGEKPPLEPIAPVISSSSKNNLKDDKSKQQQHTNNSQSNRAVMESIHKTNENPNTQSKDKKEVSKSGTSKTIDNTTNIKINKSAKNSSDTKDNKKSQNTNNTNKISSNNKNKTSKNNGNKVNSTQNQNSGNNNTKKINSNNSSNNSNKNFSSNNNNNKYIKGNNTPKLTYTEPAKLPSQVTKTSPNDTSTDNIQFTFGKIDLNSNISQLEKIEKRQSSTNTNAQTNQEPTKQITQPHHTSNKETNSQVISKDEISNNNANAENSKSVNKHKSKKDTFNKNKKTITNTSKNVNEQETSKIEPVEPKKFENSVVKDVSNAEKSVEVKSTEKTINKDREVLVSDKPKRRGRPRIKPIEDTLKSENKKAKNNKKFQNDIPQDKLSKMIEYLSKLPHISEYSHQDLVVICKVIAFGTKNETYRAFLSLLGKRKALESYSIVKKEFDTLKKLYES